MFSRWTTAVPPQTHSVACQTEPPRLDDTMKAILVLLVLALCIRFA
jgi:hypothetical protein